MIAKKKALRMLAAILAVAAIITVSGCRKVFDHAAYVKSFLDASYRADFSEYMVITGETEDEAIKLYEDNSGYFIDEICEALDIDISDESRERISDAVKRVINGAAYEVIGAQRISVDRYDVEIKVWPVTSFMELKKPILEFAEEFFNSLKSDDNVDFDPDAANVLFLDGLTGVIENGTQTISYGAEKTIIAPVEYDRDKKTWYIAPLEQGKLFDALIYYSPN